MPVLVPGFTIPIDYPSSDGKPVAETDAHLEALTDLRARLRAWAAGRAGAYAAGNMLVYYAEGDPRRHLAPDCFVAFGVPNHNRDTFRTWVEGTVPAVVFEVTSRSTRREDTVTKRNIYDRVWQVEEYFLFDPIDEYLTPSLQGFRRDRGRLVPIRPSPDGALTSRSLGLTLERSGERLALVDVVTGKLIRLTAEAAVDSERAARLAAEATAGKEHAARLAAEAELARVRAELAAAKKKK